MTIQSRVEEHMREALQFFPQSRIIGIFLQGSQNYGLDIEESDVDTKLIVTPTFKEIAFNHKPHSTTHIRENEEHIDFKDVRLMLQTFRKQNLNFVEILFTPYKIENRLYQEQWDRLVQEREAIAHYSPYNAVKTMKGIALEKYHAMEHEYPSKKMVLAKYGYDPKQLHHLIRVQEYIKRYIAGEKYEDCLRSNMPEYLKDVKKGLYSLDAARAVAAAAIKDVVSTADVFCEKTSKAIDPRIEELLNDVQYHIMEIAIKEEFK